MIQLTTGGGWKTYISSQALEGGSFGVSELPQTEGNRKYVRGVSSNWVKVISGVQGVVLGPLLFLVYVMTSQRDYPTRIWLQIMYE